MTHPIPSLVDNPELSMDADQTRIEKIWQDRAVAIAKELPKEEASGDLVSVVLMQVGGELLGIDVHYVIDIRPHAAITHVPRVPGWVAGVTNWHGSILSVIDLRAFLDLPAGATSNEAGSSGMLVVIRGRTEKPHAQNNMIELIFQVDDVLSVETLNIQKSDDAENQIHALPGEYNHSLATRTPGADVDSHTMEQQFSLVLNVEAILSDRRLIINQSNG